MKKKRLLAAIILMLCFIWGNSLLSGESSGEISSGLLNFLQQTFPFLHWLPEVLLRKIGHFSEFGLLGMLLLGYFWDKKRASLPVLCAMLAANIDETIQVVVPNRGPSVVDVWIDAAGACLGMAVLALILKRREKK